MSEDVVGAGSFVVRFPVLVIVDEARFREKGLVLSVIVTLESNQGRIIPAFTGAAQVKKFIASSGE
jgi:hypothetical protein